jgi:t-SNARE complex subunit (syntaxin)
MCEEANAKAARRIRQGRVNMRPESLCIIIIIIIIIIVVVVLMVNDYKGGTICTHNFCFCT